MVKIEKYGPYLIAIGGHTGTGKSTLAHSLRREVAALRDSFVFDMDQTRREILGYDLKTIMKPEDYDDAFTDRVRATMDAGIKKALAAGHSAIDASGSFAESGRQHIEALARACGVPFIGLWLVAPRAVMEARITRRLAEREAGQDLSVERGHASDACLGVLDKFGDIGLPRSKAWAIIDASGTSEAVLEAALDVLDLQRASQQKKNMGPRRSLPLRKRGRG